MITDKEIRGLKRFTPEGARFWFDRAGSQGFEIRLTSKMTDGRDWHNVLFIRPGDKIADITDRFYRMCKDHGKERVERSGKEETK